MTLVFKKSIILMDKQMVVAHCFINVISSFSSFFREIRLEISRNLSLKKKIKNPL